MNEDERRKRSLEAGKRTFAKYKAEKASKLDVATTSTGNPERLMEGHSSRIVDQLESSVTEGMSSRDVTQSSVSMSEGEGDGDLEGMANRVAELEVELRGKEDLVETLTAQIHNIREEASSPNSSQSQSSAGILQRDENFTVQVFDRLEEYAAAVNDRDTVIQQLSASLEKALVSRNELLEQLNALKALSQGGVENKEVLETISSLQLASEENHKTIEEMSSRMNLMELEAKAKDKLIREYETQVEKLNEEIRTKRQYEERVEKLKKDMQLVIERVTVEANATNARHQQELQQLQSRHEQELAKLSSKYEKQCKSLREENRLLADRLNKELPEMEGKHAKELSVFQAQLASYKKTVQSLKQELAGRSECQQNAQSEAQSYRTKFQELEIQAERDQRLQDLQGQREKEMLREQIRLHKLQLEELTAKYVAATSILDSKESLERSLEEALGNAAELKRENEALRFKLDDLSYRYSTAQSLIENKERSFTGRIVELEKSFSRLSIISGNTTASEFNATTYPTLDEVALQYQLIREKLSEKEEMERLLIEKVQRLEADVLEAELAKNTCEKELKDLRNSHEKLLEEQQKAHTQDRDRNQVLEHEKRVSELLQQLGKVESERDELKRGLEEAFKQCANRTLSTTITLDDSRDQQLETSIRRQLELANLENEGLLTEIEGLLERRECVARLKETIEAMSRERETLVSEIQEMKKAKLEAESTVGKDGLVVEARADLEARHAAEMEELRRYFEEKCLQMERQYSEEVFSQQSKKMSDENAGSDVDDLSEDPYFPGDRGAAGDGPDPVKLVEKATTTMSTTISGDRSVEADGGEGDAIPGSRITLLKAVHQALLSVESDSDDNWPSELLELRDKLTGNAKREMQKLQEMHSREIAHLKEEHARSIERLREQSGAEKLPEGTLTSTDFISERNKLHRSCRILRSLVGELIAYFMKCEEEVNNTLITQVLQRELPKLEMQQPEDEVLAIERTLEEDERSMDETDRPVEDEDEDEQRQQEKSDSMMKRRVHFAPRSNEIIRSILEGGDDVLLVDDVAARRLKAELETCLHRLRSESARLLDVSRSCTESRLECLSKQMLRSNKINEELRAKLQLAENTIAEYQHRVIAAEGKKEIVSEGYGEREETGTTETVQEDLSQLQDRARSVLMNGGADNSYLLQLIEDFCRQSDRLLEDARREREDLQQQIEAADKQLRATRKFLEEQANEREVERDEASREIAELQEQLKERVRDKERDLRMSSETSSSSSLAPSENPVLQTTAGDVVESLESQLRESSRNLEEANAKKLELEAELKAAVDKIWVLRDIITELEKQVAVKTEAEGQLQSHVSQLEDVITAQTKRQQELAQELDSVKLGSENGQLNEHIRVLQEELMKHKVASEHFDAKSSVLKQMRLELSEMQSQLDKRTRELEALHTCGSSLSLSHPSEDVSIREQIDAGRGCQTPDDDDSAAPPTLPLDQLLGLKERLLRHIRVEEVVLKRSKDLDMQLKRLKHQNEELQAEQEVLQQTASEQLFQIEAMRGRLEQQKQSAPFAQRQATSRLELQLHEANAKIQNVERALADKDLELREISDQLKRANRLLAEKEAEISSALQNENELIQSLKDRLEKAEEEKRVLEAKLGIQERTQVGFPQLLDSMLADKNEEIDHLKEQLSKKERQLESYLEDASAPEPKHSARTLSDILSIYSECEGDEERMRDQPQPLHATMATPNENASALRLLQPSSSETKLTLDVSSPVPGSSANVDPSKMVSLRVPPLKLDNSGNSSSFEKTCRSPTRPEAEEELSGSCQGEKTAMILEQELEAVRGELETKRAALSDCQLELTEARRCLQELEESVESLSRDRVFYKGQLELSQASELKIKKDLEQVENALKLREREVEDFRGRIQANERIMTERSREGERELAELRKLVFEKDVVIETIRTRNMEIEDENKQLYEFKARYDVCRKELNDCQNEITRLTEGLNTRDRNIRRLEEMARRNSSTSGSISLKEGRDRDREVHLLQECLREKDEVIRQMSDDSKSLHRALETIQSKIKESGNVLELRKKLKEERRNNCELRETVQKLGRELKRIREESAQELQRHEDTDIEDMVQQELNLSAHLDKQIMDAIESESEDMVIMERTGCLLTKAINQVQQHHKATSPRHGNTIGTSKLRMANKANDELSKIRDDLEIEKEMLKSQVSEYEARILQIRSDLEEERRKTVSLEREVANERANVRTLNNLMQKERISAQNTQLHDSEIIAQLREEVAAYVDVEEKLHRELSKLRQEYMNLERRFGSVKEQIQIQSNSAEKEKEKAVVPQLSSLLEAEQLKYLALSENYEKLERSRSDLLTALKTTEREKKLFERQLDVAMEEKGKILSNLALVEGVKERLESDLKRVRSELKAREEDCSWLQKRIDTMTKAESQRQQQQSNEISEWKSLKRELDNAREVMLDLEADMKQSKEELTRSLKGQEQLAQELRAAKEEESKLKEVIRDVQSDLQASIRRELELTDQLQRERFSDRQVPSKYIQKIQELNSTIEKYSQAKNTLQERLDCLMFRVRELEAELANQKSTQAQAQVQTEAPAVTPGVINNTELMQKLTDVSLKFCRADSRRKALIFQKNYLLCVIGGYQLFEKNTFSVLAQLTRKERLYVVPPNSRRKNAKMRFKYVTRAVISIVRMKWLIVRWQKGGKRVAAIPEIPFNSEDAGSHLARKPLTVNHSPPVRERSATTSTGTSNGRGTSAAPYPDLESYLKRFMDIKETLDQAVEPMKKSD